MMGFSNFLRVNRVQEWESFYFDYQAANQMLEQYVNLRSYEDMKITTNADFEKPLLADAFSQPKATSVSWINFIDVQDQYVDFETKFVTFLDEQFHKVCKFYQEQEDLFVYNVNQLAHELYFQTEGWKNNPSGASELQVRAKELYRGLELVKKFCDLNGAGFRKILKKHHKRSNLTGLKDKITAEIEKSVINSPPLINEMGRKLEHMYATNFTRGDVKQSVKELRGRKENHGGDLTSFKVGLTVGVSLCCIVTIIIYSSN